MQLTGSTKLPLATHLTPTFPDITSMSSTRTHTVISLTTTRICHSAPSAQLAAAVADRNERVSIKYDAVMDLIRMLAAWKAHQSNAAIAGAKLE